MTHHIAVKMNSPSSKDGGTVVVLAVIIGLHVVLVVWVFMLILLSAQRRRKLLLCFKDQVFPFKTLWHSITVKMGTTWSQKLNLAALRATDWALLVLLAISKRILKLLIRIKDQGELLPRFNRQVNVVDDYRRRQAVKNTPKAPAYLSPLGGVQIESSPYNQPPVLGAGWGYSSGLSSANEKDNTLTQRQ
jgi:hypothetical protein